MGADYPEYRAFGTLAVWKTLLSSLELPHKGSWGSPDICIGLWRLQRLLESMNGRNDGAPELRLTAWTTQKLSDRLEGQMTGDACINRHGLTYHLVHVNPVDPPTRLLLQLPHWTTRFAWPRMSLGPLFRHGTASYRWDEGKLGGSISIPLHAILRKKTMLYSLGAVEQTLKGNMPR